LPQNPHSKRVSLQIFDFRITGEGALPHFFSRLQVQNNQFGGNPTQTPMSVISSLSGLEAEFTSEGIPAFFFGPATRNVEDGMHFLK
jgi:hypothetical protein